MGSFGPAYDAATSAFDCAALKRRQKLRVKAVVSALDPVVRSRRLHIAHQLFAEVPFKQARANLLAGSGQIERDGDVGVECSERLVVERLRERVQAVEAVCPATDDDDLVEPRFEGFDQAREILDIGWTRHYGFSSKIGARTRCRISSACASPRAGWELTSSQTCRMSATGTPLRTTAARKTDSRKAGIRT